MSAASTHGSCLCGAVRFTAALPSLWVAHCHCSFCRRAHGTAFVTWVGLDEAGVAIADPQGTWRYDSHVAWVTLGDALPTAGAPAAPQ